MKPRTARFMAWSLVALYIILAASGLTLQFLANASYTNIAFPVLLIIIPLIGMWPAIGALIISRHPHHPVGWLLCLGLMAPAFDMFFSGYVTFDINVYAGTLPGFSIGLLWLVWSGFPFATTAFTLMILLFPDGHPPSPFWRKVAWTAVGALLFYLPIQAVHPGPVDPFTGIFLVNPLGVSPSLWAVLEPFWLVGLALLALCNLAAVISLILRLRHGRGEERQQVKWLVIPAAVYFATIPFVIIGLVETNAQILGIAIALVIFSVPGMVIATAIAIFKYRLYDIDLIINRTLVYGALTAGVVGLYALVVGGMGLAFQSNSNLAAALLTTTLVVVLFRPLRAQLRRGVDRLVPVGRAYGNTPAPSMAKSSRRSFDEQQETVQELVRDEQADKNIIRLPAWVRPFLRMMWFLGAAVLLGIIVLNVPSQINTIGTIIQEDLIAAGPSWMAAVTIATTLAYAVVPLISLVLAGVLYFKRPNDGMALFLSYFLLVLGIVVAPLLFLEPFLPNANAVPYSVIQPLIFAPLLIAFLSTFPNGRLVPAWTRWLIVAAIIYAPVLPILIPPEAKSDPTPLYIIGVLTWFVLIIAGFYAQIYRYRHVSNPIERQQTKWVIYGFTLTVFFAFMATIWTIRFNSQPQEILPPWSQLGQLGWILAYAILPITLTIAVMRYRLFDIDLIINRTLVYGALTAGVVGLYALVVGSLGVLFRSGGNLIVALIATGLVAVLFQPLRERMQRAVNHLMYGARDDPLEALAQLGKQLESAVPTDDVLLMLVETVAQTLKLPYVAIQLPAKNGDNIAAEFGNPSQKLTHFPLIYQGESIGRLVVALRSPGSSFSAAEKRLLRNIARQAGAAVHAVQLTIDLQRSRQRLVTAREEERRRLRRDLHDGLGATLAAINLEVGALKRSIRNDPEQAESLADDLRQDIRDSIENIRHLVYELRPPTLDQLGLVEAVRTQAAQCSREDAEGKAPLEVKVEAPEKLPPLPAAVEVAAYRIAQEALTNVVTHARALHCVVRLEMRDGLQLEVVDDGVGVGNGRPKNNGLGLLSMRERAEELGGVCLIEPVDGGGTRVLTSLPLLET